jgi:hypothetical protein
MFRKITYPRQMCHVSFLIRSSITTDTTWAVSVPKTGHQPSIDFSNRQAQRPSLGLGGCTYAFPTAYRQQSGDGPILWIVVSVLWLPTRQPKCHRWHTSEWIH